MTITLDLGEQRGRRGIGTFRLDQGTMVCVKSEWYDPRDGHEAVRITREYGRPDNVRVA